MPTDTESLIKTHEGYKEGYYIDTLGNVTCGWGHLIRLPKVTQQVAEGYFKEDYDTAYKAAKNYIGLTEFLNLSSVRRAVLIDMAFNLGYKGLCSFKKLKESILVGNFEEASKCMLDSRWATQVKTRALHLAKMMEHNTWEQIS